MPAPAASTRLYSPPFITVLAVTLLGFGSFSIVQTILPLYVLELGGNATVGGDGRRVRDGRHEPVVGSYF